MSNGYEYARHALIGIATPQANPTVEPEIVSLVPSGVGMVTTRLTGHPADARQRFRDYLDNLGKSIELFGALKPDVLGFACTSTGYLIGAEEEDRRLEALSARAGYPIISSSQAIRQGLSHLGVRTIDLVSPYPPWLTEASIAYWSDAGFEVTSSAQVIENSGDILDVYRVRSEQIPPVVHRLSLAADVVLLAGTGMASLRVIPTIERQIGRPVLSSNICLAWSLLKAASLDHLVVPAAHETLFSWQARAAAVLGN